RRCCSAAATLICCACACAIVPRSLLPLSAYPTTCFPISLSSIPLPLRRAYHPERSSAAVAHGCRFLLRCKRRKPQPSSRRTVPSPRLELPSSTVPPPLRRAHVILSGAALLLCYAVEESPTLLQLKLPPSTLPPLRTP